MFHHKIPVKAKLQTAVFQYTLLGEFEFLDTALTAFAMTGPVWLASHVKHPTRSRKKTIYLRSSSRGFVLPELTHIFQKFKYTPAVRSNILSKLISAKLCVRAYYGLYVLIEDIGRRLPL